MNRLETGTLEKTTRFPCARGDKPWAALSKQALADRVGDRAALEGVVRVWLDDRLARSVRVNWRFRVGDARVKLECVYPHLIG